jgi:hypothetical protein
MGFLADSLTTSSSAQFSIAFIVPLVTNPALFPYTLVKAWHKETLQSVYEMRITHAGNLHVNIMIGSCLI